MSPDDALTGHAARMAAQREAFLATPQVRSREEAMRAVIDIEGTPAAMHADALLAALQGLLQALPSATTHPAIRAARSAVAKATSEQESAT